MLLDIGQQALFNLSVVGEELLFIVVAPDLSLSHDCGLFDDYPDLLVLKYNLECSDGGSTEILVSGTGIGK